MKGQGLTVTNLGRERIHALVKGINVQNINLNLRRILKTPEVGKLVIEELKDLAENDQPRLEALAGQMSIATIRLFKPNDQGENIDLGFLAPHLPRRTAGYLKVTSLVSNDFAFKLISSSTLEKVNIITQGVETCALSLTDDVPQTIINRSFLKLIKLDGSIDHDDLLQALKALAEKQPDLIEKFISSLPASTLGAISIIGTDISEFIIESASPKQIASLLKGAIGKMIAGSISDINLVKDNRAKMYDEFLSKREIARERLEILLEQIVDVREEDLETITSFLTTSGSTVDALIEMANEGNEYALVILDAIPKTTSLIDKLKNLQNN